MRWLLVVAMLGCAQESVPPRTAWWNPLTLPDGNPGATVTCRYNIGHCYELAGQLCPTGYDILDHDRQDWVEGHGGGFRYGNTGAASYDDSHVFRGTLIVRCRSVAIRPSRS